MYSADGEFVSFTRLVQLDKAVEVQNQMSPPLSKSATPDLCVSALAAVAVRPGENHASYAQGPLDALPPCSQADKKEGKMDPRLAGTGMTPFV